jgi:hypothetical protein
VETVFQSKFWWRLLFNLKLYVGCYSARRLVETIVQLEVWWRLLFSLDSGEDCCSAYSLMELGSSEDEGEDC